MATRSQIDVHKISLLIATDKRDKTTKINPPNYLFSTGKSYFQTPQSESAGEFW